MNPNTKTVDRPVSTADVAREMEQRHTAGQPQQQEHNLPLLPRDFSERLEREWMSVQASFVDEPRTAVQRADELVAGAIKQIADTFSRERTNLESQWDRKEQVSTEDLRVALTRYRSFFHRLLSM